MSSAGQHSSESLNQRTRLWGNLLLALFKGVFGWLTGSKALAADAFRSVADAAFHIAPMLRGRLANRSKDSSKKKAEDEANQEARASLLVSVGLLMVGLEIGISAAHDIVNGVTAAPKWYALAAIAVGTALRVLFLRTNEGISGLYCSLISLLGAGAAIAGSRLDLPELYYFDPAAAIVIAVIVMNLGYRSLAEAVQKGQIAGQAEEEASELLKFVQRIEGVIAVSSLRAREHGHYVLAEAVIKVNPRISIQEGNEIAKRVKLLLMKRFGHVSDAHIYVEPYDAGLPYKSNHDPNQEQMPTLLQ